MTITADYQAELRSVTIGAGTNYRFAEPPEGFGTPSYRDTDYDRVVADGERAGLDLLNARKVVFDLWVVGSDDADCESKLMTLKGAWRPSAITDIDLNVRFAGTEYVLHGRPRGVVADIGNIHQGITRARCEFKATDPRLYGATLLSTTINKGSSAAVSNTGNTETPWVATLTGPLTNPVFGVSGGQKIWLTHTLSSSSNKIVIDSDTHIVALSTIDGVAAYSSLASNSQWWKLPPGGATIELTADSGTGNVKIERRPAWV